ncbi:glycosyl transferase [Loigolactobacillus backii]|nr:glycosyltransferase [Loigolactobacillus backii]PIO82421.1 glycosyl transferase [Loigolactobacillus backii]
MQILYCGNDQMFRGVLLSVLSLLKNTSEPLEIYILTAELQNKHHQSIEFTEKHANFINEIVTRHNEKNGVTRIDITDLYNAYLPTANTSTMFTPYSMLRLYADQIPELSGRILYLDADVLCRQPFADFYHQSLVNTEIVGTLDYYGRWFFHHQWRKFDYLNSGVLLLNLNLIRQTHLFEKCRKLCKKRPMIMPDQSTINKYSKLKRITDRRYNEQHGRVKDTVFQHFSAKWKFWPVIHTESIKPWEIDKVHQRMKIHDYDDLYEVYQGLLNQLPDYSVTGSTSSDFAN